MASHKVQELLSLLVYHLLWKNLLRQRCPNNQESIVFCIIVHNGSSSAHKKEGLGQG